MTRISKETAGKIKTSTRLVHLGRDASEQFGFVNTPIYRGSTVLHPTVADLQGRTMRFAYGTHGSPTIDSLEKSWADLSGAAGAVAVGSGLAAVTLALLTVVKAGDHILVVDSVYGRTRSFCDSVLKRLGVETEYYDPMIGARIADLIRANTSVVFTEAPGSQTFEMQDVPAISAAAQARGCCVMIDNTWATPLYFPPHERGADIAIEAGTKYLGGHSDILLGLVSANARWNAALRETSQAFAMCAGPEDAFLALRGFRTMQMRLKHAGEQALDLARWLEQRPEVLRVIHPALESHPGHALWKRDFSGSSGLFAMVLKPVSGKAVAAMLDGLELFGMGYSWGGFESLIVPFDASPGRTATTWAPGGPTIRVQVGFEHLDDLKRDLDAGFARLRAAS